MKKSVLVIVNELCLATAAEIESVLKELTGEVKKRTLFSNLKRLEEEKKVFKLLSGENSYEVEGYIPGPNMEAEDDFDVKKVVAELGLQARDTQEIDWGLFSSRVLDELVTELLTLQEDLEKAYDEPKSVEMRYFDLSIKYHELYGFFFDVCGTTFLLPAESMLNECRIIIDKKEV